MGNVPVSVSSAHAPVSSEPSTVRGWHDVVDDIGLTQSYTLSDHVVFQPGGQRGSRWSIGRLRGQDTIDQNVRGHVLIGDLFGSFFLSLFPGFLGGSGRCCCRGRRCSGGGGWRGILRRRVMVSVSVVWIVCIGRRIHLIGISIRIGLDNNDSGRLGGGGGRCCSTIDWFDIDNFHIFRFLLV